MGEVYLAEQSGPGGFSRSAVVKLILPHLAKDQTFIDLFLNEARISALLSHPNIVQVYELGQDGDALFIAMEYVHGMSVRSLRTLLLEQGRLVHPVVAARIITHVLHALHHAHCFVDRTGKPRPVIHRDVSPDNILLGVNGMVKVVDFGVARMANETGFTTTASLQGKYPYMTPEFLEFGHLSPSTDVYAAGICLYELLTGERPYRAPTDGGLVKAILTTSPRALEDFPHEVPAALAAIVMRAIAKRAEDRFSSAEAMAKELESWLSSRGSPVTDADLANLATEAFAEELEAREKTAGTDPGRTLALRPPTNHGSASKLERARTLAWIGGATALGAILVLLLMLSPWSTSTGRSVPDSAARLPSEQGAGSRTAAVPAPEESTPAQAASGRAQPVEVAPPEAAPPSEAAPIAAAQDPVRASPPTPSRKRAERARPTPSATGMLDVQVFPWAEVWLDGRKVGITPMQPFELSAGKHRLVLKNPQLNAEQAVVIEVRSGQRLEVKRNLYKQ